MKVFDRPWFALLAIFGAWLLLVLLALLSRHVLTVDETRYLSVAWEMWARGDWLVPHLNGEAYHHKPPLLFWLINLMWKLFGVGEAAARLVPAGAGLAGALLAMPLAAQLWPRQGRIAALAAWLLFTTMLWTFWTTAMMFDLLIAVCAELALLGILLAWRGRPLIGWLTAGLGIGLGVLAKGPVILVYVLPAALLAPWWMTEQRPASWRAWYSGVLAALLLGSAIGLSWALPAAAAGGEVYANHLLFGQTTGRVVDSFAHRHPFWWYLPLLPLLFFPWSVWAPLWRSVRERWRQGWESGERLALLSAAIGLLVFSLISGKQVHYLLPLFPVLALFAARALAAQPGRALKVWEIALPVAPLLLIGLGLIVLPYTSAAHGHAVWIAELSPLVGVPVVVAMILATLPVRRLPVAVWPGIVSLCFIWASYPSAIREVARNYDVTAVGALIGEQQRNGRPIAFLGGYLGEFHFAGRLTQPIEEVDNQSLGAWAAAHPNGLLVDRPEQRPSGDDAAVLYAQPYRSSFLVLRDAAPR